MSDGTTPEGNSGISVDPALDLPADPSPINSLSVTSTDNNVTDVHLVGDHGEIIDRKTTTETDQSTTLPLTRKEALVAMGKWLGSQVPQLARAEAEAVVTERDKQRQALEDSRANHRNLNRMLTLIGALLIGLVVTYTLQKGMWGGLSKTLAPYSFVITVLLDCTLAAYSFIKRY